MSKREGTKLSGWCMTGYCISCHRPGCTCLCHGERNGEAHAG